MHDFIRHMRDEVFFGESFESVGQWLQQSPGPDAIWAQAILDASQAFAFEDGAEGKQAGEGGDDGGDGNESGDDGLPPAGHRTDQQVFQVDEYLIYRFKHYWQANQGNLPLLPGLTGDDVCVDLAAGQAIV